MSAGIQARIRVIIIQVIAFCNFGTIIAKLKRYKMHSVSSVYQAEKADGQARTQGIMAKQTSS